MTEQQQKLQTLVRRVQLHQTALKLSDVRFVARYQRYLGSTKSWRDRLCALAWDEFGSSLGKWEKRLSAFVAALDGGVDISGFYDRMPIATYGQGVYDQLQGQANDRRVAFLVAPTGGGKSWTMRWLANANPTDTVYVHANRGWKDSMMQIARGLARAVGATEESGGAATFGNAAEALREHPITMMIDDVHEGGVLMLKLVKHLVDDTRAKFVLGTYPTAWNALVNGSTDAHSEAQQILGRALKPVNTAWMKGCREADVAAYLKLALGAGEWAVPAERMTPVLRKNGNLRTLADAVELAQNNADVDGEDVTPDLVEEAVAAICPQQR